ncbi:MAG: hypothetical protein NTU49_03610 [Gammaproteobacteria bacterium]|nr:hypothetical protein [Gammaproteobacteria bacterium]
MHLENRFFYRFVKVWRIFWIFLAIIATLFILWRHIPSSNIPDNMKSTIFCTRTKVHADFLSLGIMPYPYKNEVFSESDDTRAMNFCGKDYHGKSILQGLLDSDHDVNIVYYPRNWFGYPRVTLTTTSLFLIFYILLNLFCEALLYLFLGKKLSWRWLLPFKKNQGS